jgi:hypothetical protein
MTKLMSGSPADAQLASETLALLGHAPRPRRTHESAASHPKPKPRQLHESGAGMFGASKPTAQRRRDEYLRGLKGPELVRFLRQDMADRQQFYATLGRPESAAF